MYRYNQQTLPWFLFFTATVFLRSGVCAANSLTFEILVPFVLQFWTGIWKMDIRMFISCHISVIVRFSLYHVVCIKCLRL